MITLPTLQPTLAWHQQLPWRRYIEQLFRLVSRRRDFRLELQQGKLIAGVIPEQRRVLLNPDLIPVPAMGVRFDPQTPHGQRTQLLRAIMAHEAGHVVFSASKPAGELGWLWNALEDERMERLVMRRFPELCSDFDFLGDAMLLKSEPEPTDFMTACLRWRWSHDRPDVPFELLPQDQEAWQQARPLVEEAWETTRERVELLAAQILALRPAPPTGESPKSRPELSADGGGMSEEQPEEQEQRQGTGGSGDGEKTEAEGTDGGEKIPEQEDDQAEDTASTGVGDSPELEEHAPEEREGDSERTTATASNEEDANEQGQPQQGRGEVLLPAPPPPAPGEEPSQGVSDHAGPARDLSRRESAQEILDRVEVHARHLTRILAPPIRPAQATPHRSKGRFRYDRYTQGAEKYFGRKVGENRPAPFLLRLVIDVSSSMAGGRLNAAQEAALMLARAAHLAGSRLQVISFDYDAYETVPLDLPWAESVDAIAGLEAKGGTLLSNALRLVLAGERQSDEREVIAIICDGELMDSDRIICERLLAFQEEARTIVPLLIGEGIQGMAMWEKLFGTAVPVHNTENIARVLHQLLIRIRRDL